MSKNTTNKHNRNQSPSATIRQAERDRFMRRYLQGKSGEVPVSPSEIYSKQWRVDGDKLRSGKRGNDYLIQDLSYFGPSTVTYHPGSDAGCAWEETCGWWEPGPRKFLGKITPEDYENLVRLNTVHTDGAMTPNNKNMEENVIKLKESTLRKIIAESVIKVLKENTPENAGVRINRPPKRYLSESELKHVIAESVKKVLNEDR